MISFQAPQPDNELSYHHTDAARGNEEVTTEAIDKMLDVLRGHSDTKRILLKAAAGAGKSFALKSMVATAIDSPLCKRVGVVAFANKQLFPLAEDIGNKIGREDVCLYVSKERFPEVAQSVRDAATVVDSMANIPDNTKVLISTSHMIGRVGTRIRSQLGEANAGELFDVLFVDEAWQLPLYLYSRIERRAPLCVGVGDVGQLPPLDPSLNPWRGDPGYNPYRAWPTSFDDDPETWSRELPAVWRPTGEQLPLWRAFYREWEDLNCVAAPGDRAIDLGHLPEESAPIWQSVASGTPTVVEVAGLPPAEAADIDPALLRKVEHWLDELFTAGFSLTETKYGDDGGPVEPKTTNFLDIEDKTVIALLTTRNQAADDAHALADRLTEKHSLRDGALVASTVDSWQGQTNAITVAIHPLSGASQLSDFNSAFGRLAVTCTRATHGLLLVSRVGIDDLLSSAAARPGTPLGEPGIRQLPRQTHQRILRAFNRGVLHLE